MKADSYADLKIAATDENGEDVSALSSESRMCLMGSGMFPAAFDEQVIGLKKGQTASFSVNVEDAKDATLMASLEGKTKTVNFEVEVLAVKKQVLPELTDEWVKDTLGFDDVADLRERVADSIKEQKEDVLPRMKGNACLRPRPSCCRISSPSCRTRALASTCISSRTASPPTSSRPT